MIVVETALAPPPGMRRLTIRPRLQAPVPPDGWPALTIVHAPAGYGKTSLLAGWHQALGQRWTRAAWLTALPATASTHGLMAQLRAALARADRQFADEPAGAPSVADDAAELLNLVRRAGTPIFLFLDDAGRIARSPLVGVLSVLVEHAPPNLHLVVASRERLSLPTARWRAQGRAVELDQGALRFDAEEAARFLQAAGTIVGEADIDALIDWSEGWPTAIAIRGAAPPGDPGPSAHLAAFFAEEVFEPQPVQMQSFLLDASAPDELSPALGDAIAGRSDGARLLAQAERANLFLRQIDARRPSYRFHRLFAEYLRRRLADDDPRRVRLIRRRASRWYEQAGDIAAAFEHAVEAAEPARAAALLNRWQLYVNDMGKGKQLVRLAEKLPPEVLGRFPYVLLTTAWTLSATWRFAAARRMLDQVRQKLAALQERPAGSDDETRQIAFLLKHQDMMLAQFQDDMPTVEKLCVELLADATVLDPYIRGTIHTSILFAQRAQFNLANLLRFDAEARAQFRRGDNLFALVWHEIHVGGARFAAGDTENAAVAFENAIEVATRFLEADATLPSIPGLALAAVRYERNELAEAQALVDRHFAHAVGFGFADQLVAAYVTQSRLLHRQGLFDAAYGILNEGLRHAKRYGFDRLHWSLIAERLRLLALAGHVDELGRVAREEGLDREPFQFGRRSTVTATDEMRALAWVRFAQSRGLAQEGLAIARRWQSLTCAGGAFGSSLRWDIAVAQLHLVGDDAAKAQRALRRAITVAAPRRFVRSFVNAGSAIAALLEEQRSAAPVQATGADLFVAEVCRVLAAEGAPAGRPATPDTIEIEGTSTPLSPKEMEILALAGAGVRDREIARKFGVTEAAVKWRLQQIYDKVGVRRRAAAFQRLRRLGIIP